MIAFLFPGQGSQFVGMGKALAERWPAARALFEEADRVLGLPLNRLMWEGPEDKLRQTEFTQPALFVASVAAARVLGELGIKPAVTAGHSLGEYSALAAAGALEFEAGLRAVRERGKLMEEAGREAPGGMAALLGMSPEGVSALCAEVANGRVCQPVNFNAPDQIVIAGDRSAIEEAVRLAPERGAKRALALNVSGAFHSSLMSGAALRMKEVLEGVSFREARCPVVTNCDARPTREPDEFRAKLTAQIDHPVLWERSIRAMREAGAELFVETGPGHVLLGLLKRTDRSARGLCTDEDPSLAHIMKEVNACGFKGK